MESELQEAWRTAQQFFDSDQMVELQVIDANKGGLLVNWNGLQGFVPASQLIDFPSFHLEDERVQELKRRRDHHLHLKIIELEPENGRLILSERIALVQAEQRQRLLHHTRAGEKVRGVVTNLTNFGVFVDLGGVEGLIHISELSWMRVNHPSDIVCPGQEITVLVLNVNRDEGRVALSLKQLQKDPWQNVAERYQPGQLVEGVVTHIMNFGAFILLEESLEGLIHTSQFSEDSLAHPRTVVNKGDHLMARVLEVDGQARRLALSLRHVEIEPET